jgi:hypothetical protein
MAGEFDTGTHVSLNTPGLQPEGRKRYRQRAGNGINEQRDVRTSEGKNEEWKERRRGE